MSMDPQDFYVSGSHSNCCGAEIDLHGMCRECGEHCEDESEEGPTDSQIAISADRHFQEEEKYRQEMKDAGRGHLLS